MNPTLAAERLADLARLLRRNVADKEAVLRAVDLAVGIARGRIVLRSARLGRRVHVGSWMRVVNEGEITIGDQVCFFGGMIPSELVCHEGATLSIESGCEFNYGVSIEAGRLVRIGRRCKIGSLVRIADGSRSGEKPVVIGDDVWIAHGAILEPGVTIGDGSVVSAGSVVTTSIPAGSLAIGNPARAVRLDVVAKAASPGGPHA